MLSEPYQIAKAAEDAGMRLPPDIDNVDPEQFPHFHVYCAVQLGCSITWGNHWNNAKIIAAIPDDKIKQVTHEDLEALGFNP